MKLVIGVAGSAAHERDKMAEKKAFIIGREIARAGAILATGASTGIPHSAVKGAVKERGCVIGFSPALNKKDHEENFRLPTDGFDLIAYTGFNLKGRNVIFVRSCDALICVGGRIGTLNEFTIAYDEGKPIGILKSGGITELISSVLKQAGKKGAEVIYESDAKKIVGQVLSLATK